MYLVSRHAYGHAHRPLCSIQPNAAARPAAAALILPPRTADTLATVASSVASTCSVLIPATHVHPGRTGSAGGVRGSLQHRSCR